MELETQMQIASELGYLCGDTAEVALGKAREVGRMLNGLIEALNITLIPDP